MDIKEAVQTLAYIAETEEEKQALKFLGQLAVQAEKGEKASYKQAMFITKMADAAGVDVFEAISQLGITPPDSVREIPKKDASKIIKAFIERGYNQNMGQ